MSELISLLVLTDFQIHPASHFTGEFGYTERNGGNPELEINRSRLLRLAAEPQLLYFYILHETTHNTHVGWANRFDQTREIDTNSVTREILSQLGKIVDTRNEFSPINVTYHSGVPAT